VQPKGWTLKFSKSYMMQIIILIVVLLCGCTSFTNSTADIQYVERPKAEYQLGPSGIYALNRETVFLFGGVREVSNDWWGPYYSMLLRSDDGGKHWQEVMQPVVGSDLAEMDFLENRNGWALVVWITEGAGPASLYRTTDYGES
jgi:hypothetical protein